MSSFAMELGSIPITVAFTADHVLIHDPTELLKISFHRLFYYVILETKLQVIFFMENETGAGRDRSRSH